MARHLSVTGGLSGAMPPNIRGQDSYARHLLERIIEAECRSGRSSKTEPFHDSLCNGTDWQKSLHGYRKTQAPNP